MLNSNQFLFLILFFVINILINILLTRFTISFAKTINCVDNPNSAPSRKFQKKSIPLLGLLGTSIWSVVLMSLVWLSLKFNWLNNEALLRSGLFYEFKLYWIIIGACIIMVAGFLDDKINLKPKIYFPLVFFGLIISVFLGGLKIEVINTPFINLNLKISFLPQLLALLWVGACLSATKFLDGLDGLVSSIGILAFLIIAFVANKENVNQPLIFIFSVIWMSGLLGFFWFNKPEARVYLGEGGSTAIGFWIGVLSILSGAKVATSFSVIGWFILDIIIVMLIRVWRYKSISGILKADSDLHWHHRLRNLNLTKWQTLGITILVISLNSFLSLIINNQFKFFLIISQIICLITFFYLSLKKRK
jgi:UDP-GlcNAc:undecaprenyl-phosphate/decaprenyl-phosphate GlcNAc-1-phosphate transferase